MTDFNPTSGAPGTSVEIRGSSLGNTVEVRFGMALAIFTVASDTRLVATVPLDATTGPITVGTTTGSAVSARSFTVAPRISDFTPAQGPPGAQILIEGNNFEGASFVQFNGSNAVYTVTGPTQIQAIVPTGATSGPIAVATSAGLAISSSAFAVVGLEPFINSFSPTNGAPGASITINGLNFTGATSVKFNGTNAVQFTVTSPTQIRAIVPSAASTGPLSVSTAAGTGVSSRSFLVSTAPLITGFEPIGGPAGTDIVITGANFMGTTAVQFAGKNASTFFVTAGTQLHATVPSGATNGSITVISPQGSGTSADTFYAGSSPFITDFAPNIGPVRTVVAINGINFATTKSVVIGGASAQFDITAPTQLIALVPENATNGPITVTTSAGSATSAFPFLVETGKPVILTFDPTAGVPRTIVTITGFDLSNVTSVQFNGTKASFSILADTQISALVPDNATSGPISVTSPAGSTTNSVPFLVAPRIASFDPMTGAAHTLVTVKGTNFTQIAAVKFNGVPALFTNASPDQLTAEVPEEATTGSLSITTPAGIVATSDPFVVLPRVTRFTPTSGPVGTEVSVFGTGFGDVGTVTFGGVSAPVFEVLTSTQLVAVVPPRAVSGVVGVTTASGSAISARPFVVGLAANLGVKLTASIPEVLVNQVFAYTLSVTNQGPAAANGLVLSNAFSQGADLLSATASAGVVTRSDSGVKFSLQSLPVGAGANLVVTLLATAQGTITNVATLTATELDPEGLDNALTWTTAVLANPAVLKIEELSSAQLRLSWPVAATNFVLQASGSISPTARWQTVNVTPVVSGSVKSVTFSPASTVTFFRLTR